uniref:Peptidase M16 middle/third domain-containing protein n=1 Tax=Romanomermis culicivorax TaxID=13658 RepID=A0A915I4Z3_ROMCU
MRLIFPIPKYNLSLENSGLFSYVIRLFGDQRPGGLFHKLKRDGFIHFLTIRFQKLAKSFAFFNVEMQLTSSGIERWRQILRTFFQFTGFTVGQGVQELFYDDMKFLESLDYRFKTVASSLNTATLTNELLYERNVSFRKPIYLFPRLPKMIDGEKFRNFYSDLLQPDNCIITLISPEFRNETNRIEKWFNTKYRLSKLSTNFSTLLQKDQTSGDHQFRTFPSNDLIPTRFNLLPLEDGKLSLKPVMIIDNDHLTAWYKQELRYSQPRTAIYAKISSSDQFSDPQLAIAAEIYAKSVNHQWKVDSFDFNVKMASHKMSILLDRSITLLLNSSNISQSAFQSSKTRTLQTLEKNQESSLKNLDYYSEYLTTKNIWSREERIAAGENLTYAQFRDINGIFFSRSHVESFIFGNTNKKEAIQFNRMISDIWNPKNQSKSARKKRKNIKNFIRPILLPEGGEFVFRLNASNVSDDSYVRILYQNADDSNLTDVVLNDFLCFLLEKECYDQLRVKEKVGSALECKSWSHFGVYGLQITVVGRKPPDYLDERIDQFLNRSQLFLKALPNFDEMKELRISDLRRTPDGDVTLADNFWFEIVNGRYDFDRGRREIDLLRHLTKENMKNFHQTKLSLKSSKRRKLSIHIAGGDIVPLQKSELKNQPAKRKASLSVQGEKQ